MTRRPRRKRRPGKRVPADLPDAERSRWIAHLMGATRSGRAPYGTLERLDVLTSAVARRRLASAPGPGVDYLVVVVALLIPVVAIAFLVLSR